MLFQQAALFDSLTVGENVAYPLREHRLCAEPELRERVRAHSTWWASAAPSPHAGRALRRMRKRAALARALVLEPRAVLYDEPPPGSIRSWLRRSTT